MLSCAADYNPNTRHTETKFKNKNRVRSLFGLGLNAKKRGGGGGNLKKFKKPRKNTQQH